MIKLELTVEEVNGILIALGKLPLEQAFGLWSKVKTQAEEQVAQTEPEGE